MKRYLLFGILSLFVLSACATASSAKQNASIEVTGAWVRTVGNMRSLSGSSTALFMTIQNNTAADDQLIRVESEVAETIQIHLSEMDANGVSSMHEVEGVDIPAGGTAELKSGSYHVMLIRLRRDLREGDRAAFTLIFRNAGAIPMEAIVKSP